MTSARSGNRLIFARRSDRDWPPRDRRRRPLIGGGARNLGAHHRKATRAALGKRWNCSRLIEGLMMSGSDIRRPYNARDNPRAETGARLARVLLRSAPARDSQGA